LFSTFPFALANRNYPSTVKYFIELASQCWNEHLMNTHSLLMGVSSTFTRTTPPFSWGSIINYSPICSRRKSVTPPFKSIKFQKTRFSCRIISWKIKRLLFRCLEWEWKRKKGPLFKLKNGVSLQEIWVVFQVFLDRILLNVRKNPS
jgi:hypothetical protein